MDDRVPWLTMAFLSRHLSRDPGMNENNPGIGVEYPLDANKAAIAGLFKNTQGHTSAYGGLEWMPGQMGPVKLGGSLGAVTGYERANILPMLALKAAYETPNYGVNLQFLPNPLEFKRSAVGLQFKKPFK